MLTGQSQKPYEELYDWKSPTTPSSERERRWALAPTDMQIQMAKQMVEFSRREFLNDFDEPRMETCGNDEAEPRMETCGTNETELRTDEHGNQFYGNVQVQLPTGVFAGLGDPATLEQAAHAVAKATMMPECCWHKCNKKICCWHTCNKKLSNLRTRYVCKKSQRPQKRKAQTNNLHKNFRWFRQIQEMSQWTKKPLM